MSLPDFDALRRAARMVEGMASYSFTNYQVAREDGSVTDVLSMTVYGDFFEVLGVRPVDGRLFRGDETGPGADPRVAVISESLSMRFFGGVEGVAGRTITVNGESVTVLGVAERV